MSRIEHVWQQRGMLAVLLWPLSMLYRLVVSLRRIAYRYKLKTVQHSSVPVVVVGNLTVGGTGKTPLCAFLVNYFKEAGWQPGIVSRGYGGQRHESPYLVSSADSAATVGDEPLMLFEQTKVPVCICVKRALAVDRLASNGEVDIVFADDGLQHLAMARCAEIVVVDGMRGFGNGWMLPAGPLREPLARLSNADLIAVQSTGAMHASLTTLIKHDTAMQSAAQARCSNELSNNNFSLQVTHLVRLSDDLRMALSDFSDQTVTAMAGIGHPDRFFDALRSAGLKITEAPLPDHHAYSLDDLPADPATPVFVTSKDAVKLRVLGELPVEIYEVVVQVVAAESLLERLAVFENSIAMRTTAKRV